MLSTVPGHGLIGGDLDEEFLERGVFQSDFAQRPAVLDDRAGDFLADVVAILGTEGGGDSIRRRLIRRRGFPLCSRR